MKATVLLLTYNHAPYIGQALDSVLGQVTDFPWEIIISEDCSTDGTRAIVERYARSHPDRIRLLLSERNRNDNEVIARGLRAAAGEFIAYLDGDDWWTVPHKLATQVRFLEQNPSCVMCYHSVLRIHEDGSRPPHPSLPPGPRPPMTLEDVLARYCINSCSVALRRSAIPELPDWYYSADLADWALSVLLSTRGTVGYIDEVMAAYRIHARGRLVGGHSQAAHRSATGVLRPARSRFPSGITPVRSAAVGRRHTSTWRSPGKRRGRSVQAASHALRSLWQSPAGRFLSPVARLRVLARLLLPRRRRRRTVQRAPGV